MAKCRDIPAHDQMRKQKKRWLTYPSCSIVLMLKPNVGLISSSGSLSKAAHIELFPAPSRPLECISTSRLLCRTLVSQKQNAHLLILETSFSEDSEHIEPQKFISSAPLERFNIK